MLEKPKGQSRMDNPEKLAHRIQDEDKENTKTLHNTENYT
jgi:hypothetical protein